MINGITNAIGSFFGGERNGFSADGSEDKQSVFEGYFDENSSKTINGEETEEDDKNESFLEKTFGKLIDNAPESLKPMVEGIVESFTNFLNGLMEALTNLTGKQYSLSDLTEDMYKSKDGSSDEYTNDTLNLSRTVIGNMENFIGKKVVDE